MAAMGRRGKSAMRLDYDIVSQFGRNQAIMAESLITIEDIVMQPKINVNRCSLTEASPVAIAQK